MSLLTQIPMIDSRVPGWNLFILSLGALGLYSAFVLLIQDRLRWRHRILLGIYTACLSVLIMHLNILNVSILWIDKTLDKSGMMALFLLGPISYLLSRDLSNEALDAKKALHLLPGLLIIVGLVFQTIRPSLAYTLGIFHAGSYSILQIIHFLTWNRNRGSGLRDISAPNSYWNFTFASAQLILLAGISVLCLFVSSQMLRMLGSAALGLMILFIWVRIMYAAYLSYSLSKV